MRERSPVPCAQPSPRGDAPSPLAFAKSCKGGDVSVLDPALAWDVRCIYLFIYLLTQEKEFSLREKNTKRPSLKLRMELARTEEKEFYAEKEF